MPEQSVAKEIVGSRRANGVPKSEGVFGIVFACERNATLLLASNAKKKGEDSKTTICLSFNICNSTGSKHAGSVSAMVLYATAELRDAVSRIATRATRIAIQVESNRNRIAVDSQSTRNRLAVNSLSTRSRLAVESQSNRNRIANRESLSARLELQSKWSRIATESQSTRNRLAVGSLSTRNRLAIGSLSTRCQTTTV